MCANRSLCPPSAYTRPWGHSLSAVLAGGQVAAMGPGQGFPFKMGAASSEMCNALVAAAGDPDCSDQQRRRRVLHCLDLGVPVDYEDEDGASTQTSLLGTSHHPTCTLPCKAFIRGD